MFVGWWVIFSRTCIVECLINLILKDVLFFRYENLQDVFGGYFSISWFSPFTSAPLRRANFTFHDVWQNSFKKTREGMMESLWYISLSVHFECRLLHRSKERVHVAVKAYGKKSCKFIFNARWAILKATALSYPITRCHKYTEYPLHDVIFNARWAILKATALCYPITRCHKYTEYPLHDVMLPNNFRDENRGLIWSLKKEKLKKNNIVLFPFSFHPLFFLGLIWNSKVFFSRSDYACWRKRRKLVIF